MKYIKYFESVDSLINDISKNGFLSIQTSNYEDRANFMIRKPYVIDEEPPKYLLNLLKKYIPGYISFIPNRNQATYSLYEFEAIQSDLSWGGISEYLRRTKYCLNFYCMEDEYFQIIGTSYIQNREEFRVDRHFAYLIDGESNLKKTIIDMLKGPKKYNGKYSFELPKMSET